ncbi:MAG: transglutaminase family protein [Pirellulales bacterium]
MTHAIRWTLGALCLSWAAAPPTWSQDTPPAEGPPPASAEPVPAKAEPAAEQPAAAPPAQPSIEGLTERIRQAVVTITSASRDGSRDNIGTGFIIAADGLVATNYHVIGEGRGVRVQLADGRRFDVTAIHAFDRQLDLAVLRIDAHDLPALELGDTDLVKQGQNVVALGNPAGLKYSVVAGVVSAVRTIDERPMIQVAIPIEPGNSGGPLVDLEGRVLGVLSMKSLVTPNLGFAVSINVLKPLLDKPNPIPMSRWLTIGALDPREWKPVFGATWRQRAGRITVEGSGQGFGGRSLCLWQMDTPGAPLDVAVAVQLDDENGAAGLAFCSNGGHEHFGFYPSNGRLRLTRFEGPDVSRWTILFDQADPHYVPGQWNTLCVRLQDGKVRCFVNDAQVVEMADSKLIGGRVGLVKFRNTRAEFKNFRLARELPPSGVPAEEAARIESLVQDLGDTGPLDAQLVTTLSADPARTARVLGDRAAALDRQAQRLRELSRAAQDHRAIADLSAALAAEEDQIDLFRAGLLVARLDNQDIDVDSYCGELDRMAEELKAALPAEPSDAVKLEMLRKYLFEENGFHGSRGDYYNRANSYLNEVLDDREGLPITLSVVYMELGRRIGLRFEGVGLPGHFVVRHVPAAGETTLIDVFDNARTVSRDEAAERVKNATDHELTEDDLRAATKRGIVTRMLQNLLEVSSGDPRTMLRYLDAIVTIDSDSGPHRWLRAVVRFRLEDKDGARADVDWLVEHKPANVDLIRVLDLQRALRLEAKEQ